MNQSCFNKNIGRTPANKIFRIQTIKTVIIYSVLNPIEWKLTKAIFANAVETLEHSRTSSVVQTKDIRVFWISNTSEEDLHPSIYIHKKSSNQCKINSEKSCSYEPLKGHVGPDDTGMHYCAVLSCGRFILGNGTIMRIGEQVTLTKEFTVWKLWDQW